RALRPAIALAEEGVPLDRVVSDVLNSALYADLVHADGALGTLYGPPSSRRLGELLRLPALAQTLRAIADEGPGALYGGGVGASLVEDLSAAGGVLTLDDLRSHTS